MALVTLKARVAGIEKAGSVEKAGQSYRVEFDRQSKSARSLKRALEMLGNRVKDYLKSAWGRTKLPWGLMVSAGGLKAVYGDYPRFSGQGVVSPQAHIRKRFKQGNPPMAAVSNAIQFIKAALGLH